MFLMSVYLNGKKLTQPSSIKLPEAKLFSFIMDLMKLLGSEVKL
jgi:hypothetical protein